MRLDTWVQKYDRQHGGSGALSHLQRETGLAYTTVIRAVRGSGMRRETARKLAEATGNAVSAAEIFAGSSK